MTIIAESASRVARSTDPRINRRIAGRTAERLDAIGYDLDAIHVRLRELDREWDIERAIEANASTLALTGSVLALTVHRRFALVPAIVSAFLLQHAIQGWCPPVPMLRRLGFRTNREIENERLALMKRL
ncbi:MAG: DUF2892 domain-containing protein [Planctomycetes bacterium]|nr:DUF2892 domain-containing protein [Planctomycetota bacterium]